MAENMDATGSGEQQEKRGMSRRTVLAGAAWSVPVIAVATAAPAMANASVPVVSLEGVALACKHVQGQDKRYHYELVFTNNSTLVDAYFRITSMLLTPTSGAVVTFEDVGPTSTLYGPIAPGDSITVVKDSSISTNAANGSITVQWEWTAGTESGIETQVLPHNEDGLNPCQTVQQTDCPYGDPVA